jgi:hypothetical protein
MIAFFLVLLFVSAAHAGLLAITSYGQTQCIQGSGDGSSWSWELRPEGGGTPVCSGTESFSGSQAELATFIRETVDGCAANITAYPDATLGFPCPVGMTGFSIAKAPDSSNWELALEDSTNPPNLKVPTAAVPVSFNPSSQPPVGTDKPIPCNGNNPCCGGESPPCNPVPPTGREQTICIDGVGNGSSWAWEIRRLGGGTVFCSGTGSVSGSLVDMATDIAAEFDGCVPTITAAQNAYAGPCPDGMVGVTITRTMDPMNWELAIEDNTNPPNLKVPTCRDPVFFNPGARPSGRTCTKPKPVPEPGTVASLVCGSFFLIGLSRLRRR